MVEVFLQVLLSTLWRIFQANAYSAFGPLSEHFYGIYSPWSFQKKLFTTWGNREQRWLPCISDFSSWGFHGEHDVSVFSYFSLVKCGPSFQFSSILHCLGGPPNEKQSQARNRQHQMHSKNEIRFMNAQLRQTILDMIGWFMNWKQGHPL